MGYLDNEYGWIGDENHPPKYVELLDDLSACVHITDLVGHAKAMQAIVEYFDSLESMVERLIECGNTLAKTNAYIETLFRDVDESLASWRALVAEWRNQEVRE